jgi:hypothetical protein
MTVPPTDPVDPPEGTMKTHLTIIAILLGAILGVLLQQQAVTPDTIAEGILRAQGKEADRRVSESSAIAERGQARSQQGAALTTLDAILRCQRIVKEGHHVDQDQDGVGEYVLLSELAGSPVPTMGDTTFSFLPTVFRESVPSVNGFSFVCYLPDGKGGAITTMDAATPQHWKRTTAGDPILMFPARVPRAADPAAAPAQAKHFVVYAFRPRSFTTSADGKPPMIGNDPLPAYAVTEDGIIRSGTYTGLVPMWGDVFAGGGWEAAPAWMPLDHGQAAAVAPTGVERSRP